MASLVIAQDAMAIAEWGYRIISELLNTSQDAPSDAEAGLTC
jgi:hypothetical protein